MTVSDYNTCVDQHSDGLYRFLLKHIKDTDVARDLVQDTFEKLWRKVNEIEAAKAKSYLFTTGYHTLIDYTRRAKKQGSFSEVEEYKLGHEKNYSDLKEILNRALDKLPEIQKTVILLRDYEGYDYAEIGNITNLNENQVKVYIFRARQFLKNYIGKMEVIL
ncbi:MAG: polymerase subunit sigma-24 [Bacteroidetes bacterium]|jgi:RNA polymerase sigma-70 factor (ECF subfamily)|nr:polymerase subunit sigma-24 [Bacteroidota bacterium]